MPDLATLISILDLAVKDRAQLALDNVALRHQLAVLKRSVTRPKIEDSDRIVWIVLRRLRGLLQRAQDAPVVGQG